MKVLKDVAQVIEQPEPPYAFEFVCGCGSALFKIDWIKYSDWDAGGVRIRCTNCERWVAPMEPRMNGPH